MIAVLDMYATKGIEYIVILAALAVLIPFWMVLTQRGRARRTLSPNVDWFRVPDAIGFHPGHTWAARVADGRVRLGVDDLAQAFVGAPDAITLPAVGARLTGEQSGWSFTVEGREIPMVAPLGGTVVAVNREVVADPTLLTDPYGRGWLIELEVPPRKKLLRGLLTGESARAWMAATVDALRARMGGELGPVMQDGGTPVAGFGRQLGSDWPVLCGQLFQCGEIVANAPADEPPEPEPAP